MAMRSANVIRLIISCFLQSVTKSIIASSDCKGERQVNSDFETLNMMFNFAINAFLSVIIAQAGRHFEDRPAAFPWESALFLRFPFCFLLSEGRLQWNFVLSDCPSTYRRKTACKSEPFLGHGKCYYKKSNLFDCKSEHHI